MNEHWEKHVNNKGTQRFQVGRLEQQLAHNRALASMCSNQVWCTDSSKWRLLFSKVCTMPGMTMLHYYALHCVVSQLGILVKTLWKWSCCHRKVPDGISQQWKKRKLLLNLTQRTLPSYDFIELYSILYLNSISVIFGNSYGILIPKRIINWL